jgi:hypothetical protein
VAYLAQGTGSVFCVFIQDKIGDVKSMSYFSLLNIPAMIFLIFPALKSEDLDSTNFFLSTGFVYTITLVAAFANGFG